MNDRESQDCPGMPVPGVDLAEPVWAKAILSAFLENTVDALLVVDDRGIVAFANETTEAIFGYSLEDLVGNSIERLVPVSQRHSHEQQVRRFFKDPNPRIMANGREFFAIHADGTLVPVEIGLSPFEVSGQKLVICSVRDIRKRKETQEALRLSETRSSEVQRIAKVGNWDWNIVTNELWWSDEIYRMFGMDPRGFGCTYEAFLERVHPEDREYVNDAVQRTLACHEPYSIRHRIVLSDGTEKIVHEKAEVVLDDQGAIMRMVGTVQDVTDYKRIEEEVYRSEARLKEAEHLAKIGSWEWNMLSETEWWSDGLYSIFEKDPATFRPGFESFVKMLHPGDRIRLEKWKKAVVKRPTREGPVELRIMLESGREKVIVSRTDVRRDGKGRPLSVIGTVQDVTERKRVEARVEYLATHDDLTALPNRAMFHELLLRAIKSAERYSKQGAVLFMDLDGFKYINDSLGHSAGDELLRAIGRRLQVALRQSDCAARLGGDEFCVLAEHIGDPADASSLAEKCLAVIAEPITIAGRELRPRASIGIALFPGDGQDAQTLMKAADSAMYAAKHDSQSRFEFYTSELTVDAERRMALEHDLRRSIELGDFVLHYQPQVDLATGQMLSVEALIRWMHPTRGLVGPAEFIDIAEKTDLIEKLGDWSLRTACRDVVGWNERRTTPIRAAVNISSQHFKDGRIIESVASALRETGLDPDLLEIEITERVMQASEETLSTFYRLRELGVHIAIDDFGTGYSCLESLRQLPIDTLKIDRRFIHDLLHSPEIPAILGTIVAMGRAMNLRVIAEGVETVEQVQYLCGMRCELAQGYFFSKPTTSDRIVELGARDFLPNASLKLTADFSHA